MCQLWEYMNSRHEEKRELPGQDQSILIGFWLAVNPMALVHGGLSINKYSVRVMNCAT